VDGVGDPPHGVGDSVHSDRLFYRRSLQFYDGRIVHRVSCVSALLVAASASSARANPDVDSAVPILLTPGRPHQRRFGFGLYGGGGVGVFVPVVAHPCTGDSCAESFLGGIIDFSTLEFQVFPFRHREFSIDVSSRLTETFLGLSCGYFTGEDVFFNFNVGSGTARLLIGPGLGYSVQVCHSAAAAEFRIPAEIGIELITNRESFGFKFLMRPLFETYRDRQHTIYAGGGGMFLLGMSGYKRD